VIPGVLAVVWKSGAMAIIRCLACSSDRVARRAHSVCIYTPGLRVSEASSAFATQAEAAKMLTNTTARIIFLASHGGSSWINVAVGDQAHAADKGRDPASLPVNDGDSDGRPTC
jgi:hypothetical protein